MSGKRQHVIPQMFLKRFAFQKKRSYYTNVFRTKSVHTSNIINVAVETNFYSSPSSGQTRPDLDERITRYEPRIGNFLVSLDEAIEDKANVIQPINGDIASEILGHLVIRTAHLRYTVSGALESGMGAIRQILGEERGIRALLGIEAPSIPSLFSDKILSLRPNIKEIVPEQISDGLLVKIVFTYIREQGEFPLRNAAINLQSLLLLLIKDIEKPVREGHQQALLENFVPEGRIDALKMFKWGGDSVQQWHNTSRLYCNCAR